MQEIWDFAYMFSREKGQKCVQLDTAIGMWQLLFEQLGWTLADAWCEFVQKHHRRAVSRDTWVQLLDFIRVGAFGCLHQPCQTCPIDFCAPGGNATACLRGRVLC